MSESRFEFLSLEPGGLELGVPKPRDERAWLGGCAVGEVAEGGISESILTGDARSLKRVLARIKQALKRLICHPLGDSEEPDEKGAIPCKQQTAFPSSDHSTQHERKESKREKEHHRELEE